MPTRLEVKTGPVSGKIIPVADGQIVTIGRTERSNVAIPEDNFLSSVHFALEWRGPECWVIDRKSANGTFVNGAKIMEAALREGDEIFAGKSTFKVIIAEARPSPPAAAAVPSPRAPEPKPAQPSGPPLPPRAVAPAPKAAVPKAAPPAAVAAPKAAAPAPAVAPREEPAPPKPPAPQPMRAQAPGPPVVVALPPAGPGPAIGRWTFKAMPRGWEAVDGFGIRRREAGFFPSEAMVAEDALKPGVTFDQYVQSQLDLVRLLVASPQIEAAWPAAIEGIEESKVFVVRYRTDEGRSFLQRQVYVRKGQLVGSLALTTIESESARLEPVFDQIVSGLGFGP